jgi:adenylate cyclase
MPTEIERKFLPASPSWRPDGVPDLIRQGFFWIGVQSRLEVVGNQLALYTKREDAEPVFTLLITPADAAELMAATITPKWLARVRTNSRTGASFTIKGVGQLARPEYEYPIDEQAAHRLLSLCADTLIEKQRYHLAVGQHIWEVDVFGGHLASLGMVVAEIELQTADENFALPYWAGVEVTEITAFKNMSLAQRAGLPQSYLNWLQGAANHPLEGVSRESGN